MQTSAGLLISRITNAEIIDIMITVGKSNTSSRVYRSRVIAARDIGQARFACLATLDARFFASTVMHIRNGYISSKQ
jgi:hypothetical protein